MAQLTIPQALAQAMQWHQAGRLQDAERIYRQILAQQPNHADALHLLGVLAFQRGEAETALGLIRRAIALNPGFAEAHGNLANALRCQGQLDEAAAACRRALALKPEFPDAYNNLATILKEQGHWDEAVAVYRQAIALRPEFADAHYNLGLVLSEGGHLAEAAAAFRQTIALNPASAEAHNNLGAALKGQGHLDEAVAAYRRAIVLNPAYAAAYSNLGVVLKEQGHVEEAIAAYQQAIALNPACPEAYNNLGIALNDRGRFEEAVAAYRRAIALQPGFAEVYGNLGVVLHDRGHIDEAIAACRQAIDLNPNYAAAYSNLGNALKDQGQLTEAVAAYRQAIALPPKQAEAHSNLLFALHFHPGCDARALAAECCGWDLQHAAPLGKATSPHLNDRAPDRRLRIGYVSPDFREHCQSFFTVPLLSQHDHRNFEIVCYADVPLPDALTKRLKGYTDLWRSTVGVTDEALAAQVRADRIDVLVDLTMHMDHGRPLVFARKPAPVQVCWLAYPGTTGLSAMDYRLSDPYLDPVGVDESVYSEQTIRLPETFWCYDPLDGREVAVNPLPAWTHHHITFGCLNTFCKVNEGVLRLWAKVLHAVPDSRLLLLAPEGTARQRTLDVLTEAGLAHERIEFVARRPRRQYLELYHRIDLGLDTAPYNGHTTSLDSFWMGVPVVTLVGATVVGRAGLCQLMNLNLPDLIAYTPEQFVASAAAWARDWPRLAQLRGALRQRLGESPLMDAPRFARHVEAAYRTMWRTWCATKV